MCVKLKVTLVVVFVEGDGDSHKYAHICASFDRKRRSSESGLQGSVVLKQ